MKEIFTLAIITGCAFFVFLAVFMRLFTKSSKNWMWTSVCTFIIFVGSFGWTARKFAEKTSAKITQMSSPRTGEAIYEALFDKSPFDCVKIVNFQDQIVPKMDEAIWLRFETCPNELKRILD
jgi:hypothetical protein